MKRKILTTSILVVVVASLGMTSLLVKIIYDQYQDTKQWATSPLIDEIHNVPPPFASNYIPLDDKQSLEILTKVNATIEAIDKAKGISADKIVAYERIYQEALVLADSQGLQDTDVMQNTYRLGTYIDIENALSTAYTDPNPEPLQKASAALDKFILTDVTPLDTLYSERLMSVSTDYRELQKFSQDALASLGVKDGSVLDVNINMTQALTTTLLQRIRENNLAKFDHVAKLQTLLQSDEWATIMKKNESTQNYNKWEESRKILESLSKYDYVSIASLNTYERALAYDGTITITPPQGHIVDPNSLVVSVSYNGRRLGTDDYIKKVQNSHLILIQNIYLWTFR